MNNNLLCTCEGFKTDLSQLCKQCPLSEEIPDLIERQIISQAKHQQEILINEQFQNYVNKEIASAQKVMEDIQLKELNSRKNDPETPKRTKNFIWNKERIQALNNLSKNLSEDSKSGAKANNEKNRVYTFEDWLKGEIDDFQISPEGASIRTFEDVKSINDLPKWVKVKNEDYSKIIEAKEYAYSFFLESMKKALIGKFVNSFLKSRSPEELIDIEIEECEEKINKDKRIKKEVIQGKIKSYNINSKQYRDAKERQKFYITLYINDHHTVDCYLSYRNWIRDFKDSDETSRTHLILEYGLSLNETQLDGLKSHFTSLYEWMQRYKSGIEVMKKDFMAKIPSVQSFDKRMNYINAEIRKYDLLLWSKEAVSDNYEFSDEERQNYREVALKFHKNSQYVPVNSFEEKVKQICEYYGWLCDLKKDEVKQQKDLPEMENWSRNDFQFFEMDDYKHEAIERHFFSLKTYEEKEKFLDQTEQDLRLKYLSSKKLFSADNITLKIFQRELDWINDLRTLLPNPIKRDQVEKQYFNGITPLLNNELQQSSILGKSAIESKGQMKRLLSKQYDEIVFETFKLPEGDLLKYYSNIIDEHYNSNPDIFKELEKAINRWIQWFMNKLTPNPVWEIDEHGNKTLYDHVNNTGIPLTEFGINRHLYKSFLDKQLEVIKDFEDIKDFKEKAQDFENSLPVEIRQEFTNNPMPEGFDYKKIKDRWDLVSKAYDRYKEQISSEDKIKTEPKNEFLEKLHFDEKNLSKIIFPDNIAQFVSIEQRLIGDNFFDRSGKWIKEKGALVTFINTLENKRYLKPSKNKFVNRNFFQERYNINIKEQWKPSKRASAIPKYEMNFRWIEPVGR